MIFVVDDDLSILEMASETLTAEGHKVETFSSAAKAVEKAADMEPELIISDILMPEIGGFEFKEKYAQKFPHRPTPFVFLSSLSDAENIVRGLDLGVDDYLAKPVNKEVLKAKVRSLLNRNKRYSTPIFRGDLAELTFDKLLRFCESTALTGEIEISGGDSHARLQVRGGNIIFDEVSDSVLEQLYSSSDGIFTISSSPVDFRQLEQMSVGQEKKPNSPPPIADMEKPMGKLSGVKVNNMLFQLQTEFVTYPENQIVTIVMLDGKVLMKQSKPVPPDRTDRRELEKTIEEQHGVVEDQVRDKINDLVKKKSTIKESPKEKFNRLFEAGFDRCREGKYEEALAVWEEANALNPDDRITLANIKMLRKKLGLLPNS